jgi:Zn-dependent protease
MGGDWWFSSAWQASPVLAVGWVVWVIGSIVLHELAHGSAAIRLGDDTPIRSGHMTWNPLVHMGHMSLILFAIAGIAWGMMPVDPSRLRGRYGDAIVSVAGPAMNLLLLVVALIAYVLWVGIGGGFWTSWHAQQPLLDNVQIFLRVGIALNLALALFNLLPVPPLDGFRILSSLSPAFGRLWHGEQGQVVGLIAFALVFLVGGRYIFDFAFGAASDLIDGAVAFFAVCFSVSNRNPSSTASPRYIEIVYVLTPTNCAIFRTGRKIEEGPMQTCNQPDRERNSLYFAVFWLIRSGSKMIGSSCARWYAS